jgi:aryl-alcohol dehydrogenase-like predicted oxidoreductase
MTAGPNMGGLSRKHVLQACEASLKRLGVDVIDLYWIHRFDAKTPIDETLEALNDLVRWGKVRYIGASSGSAWRMAQALSTSERNGWARFVGMQNHYNLLYREEEREMIPLCLNEGVGLVPWSPLGRGLLARQRPKTAKIVDAGTARAGSDTYTEQMYDSPDDWNVVDAVEKVAKARGVSMAEVALAWLLARPGVAAPIIGATKPEHLESALKAIGLNLSDAERVSLETPYRPHGIRGYVV